MTGIGNSAIRRATRAGVWLTFVVLVAAWWVIVNSELPTSAKQVLGDSVVYLLPLALATLTAFDLARKTVEVERSFWRLLTASLALELGVEIYLTRYLAFVSPNGPQLPAPFQALQVAALVIFSIMLVTMTTFESAPLQTRARVYADGLGGLIVVGIAAYWYWVFPLITSAPGGSWQLASVSTCYAVLGGVILSCAAIAAIGWGARPWRPWEDLMIASLGLYGLTQLLSPLWMTALLQNTAEWSASPLTVALGFGTYLFFVSAVYRWTEPPDAPPLERWPVPRMRWRWLPTAYQVALSAALPVLAVASVYAGDVPQGVPVIVATTALASVLIVRSWLLGLERTHHREAAITDPVSGAYNYRYLYERLTQDLAEASVATEPVSLIVIDVDEFQAFGVSATREAADLSRRLVAQALQEEAGPDCTVYRLGGEEFAVLAPGLDTTGAIALAHRAIASAQREVSSGGAPVGFSAGVASFPADATQGDELVVRAISAQQLARSAEDTDVVAYDERVLQSADPIERLARARRRSHRATLRALAVAADARDPDTANHSENVADLATALALVLDMSQEQTRILQLAAQFHDIGKIGIDDAVLLKQEPLDERERASVETHPVLGARMLAPAQFDDILPAVRHHHECWDGTGYPDRLKRYEIPLHARVIAVCDAFDAMTSHRRYREAMTVPQAIAEIERQAGTQFDPDIAHVFARMVGRLHGQSIRDSIGT